MRSRSRSTVASLSRVSGNGLGIGIGLDTGNPRERQHLAVEEIFGMSADVRRRMKVAGFPATMVSSAVAVCCDPPGRPASTIHTSTARAAESRQRGRFAASCLIGRRVEIEVLSMQLDLQISAPRPTVSDPFTRWLSRCQLTSKSVLKSRK